MDIGLKYGAGTNWLLNKNLLKDTQNDYLFSFQIIAYAIANDYKVDEIPVECDYNSEHTSHGYLGASKYAITHFFVLFWYILFKYLRVRRSIFK